MTVEAKSPNLGATIARLRTARGLSVIELSRLSGVPRSTLYGLEAGSQAGTSLDKIGALARALRADPAELVTGRKPRKTRPNARATKSPPAKRQRVANG